MTAFRWRTAGACVALAAFAALGARMPAQARRPMTLRDIAELRRVLDPQLSPDGASVLYMVSHADWKADRPVWNLWRQDGGRPPVQLTFAARGDIPGSTRWSPDGRTILFGRDGDLFLMPADGGEPRQLTHHPTFVGAPSWSPDGTAVYFLAADARTRDAGDRARGDIYALDENDQQRQLWKVAVSTGSEQKITTDASTVLSYHVSRDGRRIVLERAPTPLPDDGHRGEVWTMDTNGGSARVLTHNDVEEQEPQLSPDGTQILFLADAGPELQPYYDTDLFVMPAAGGAPKALLAGAEYGVDRAAWGADGRTILAVLNLGVHSELARIDAASGRVTRLTDGQHAIPPSPAPAWSVAPRAGRVAFLLDEPARFGEVWTMPIDGGGQPTRVTHVFDALERDFALPRQTKVEWKSDDGTPIQGLLFYPLDYEPGHRYPLVVQLHGGPAESDKYGAGAGLLQNYFPVLAAKGYAVLRPNYRGSSGYGDAFYRGVVGGYFAHMAADVLTGVDALVKGGIADPDRLVLMGWSAGAHLTNELITMTPRFKAASSGAGVADWISMYAQTDDRANRALWFGGTPWQANAPIEAYWNSSPLKNVARVTTPTIFFVGEADPRVPMAQSVEMYRALKSRGVATHLWVAPHEGHQWGALRHLLFKANAELEWFERYATQRPYTWESVP